MKMSEFFRGFVDSVLSGSYVERRYPLNAYYDTEDISAASLRKMKRECEKFLKMSGVEPTFKNGCLFCESRNRLDKFKGKVDAIAKQFPPCRFKEFRGRLCYA